MKNIRNILKLLISGFLLIVLVLVVMFYGNNREAGTRDNLFVLTERGRNSSSYSYMKINGDVSQRRIELLKIINPGEEKQTSKTLPTIPYSYNGIEQSVHFYNRLRPMIYNKNSDKYYFLNCIGEVNYKSLPEWLFVDLNMFLNQKNTTQGIREFFFDASGDKYISSISDNGEKLMSYKGELIDCKNGTEEDFYNKETWSFNGKKNKERFPDIYEYPVSAGFLDNNRVMLQAISFESEKPLFRINGFVSAKLPDNTVFLFNLNEQKVKSVKYGCGIIRNSTSINSFLPMDHSPDLHSVAFFCLDSVSLQEMAVSLSLWDFELDKVKKLYFIPGELYDKNISKLELENSFIVWSPNIKNQHIAFGSEKFLLVYNLDSKKLVFSTKAKNILSVRWSKDGKKLGFIDDDSLYLYSVGNESVKKVYTDNEKSSCRESGIFDFMWSE